LAEADAEQRMNRGVPGAWHCVLRDVERSATRFAAVGRPGGPTFVWSLSWPPPVLGLRWSRPARQP
jgi:hypothetical protein